MSSAGLWCRVACAEDGMNWEKRGERPLSICHVTCGAKPRGRHRQGSAAREVPQHGAHAGSSAPQHGAHVGITFQIYWMSMGVEKSHVIRREATYHPEVPSEISGRNSDVTGVFSPPDLICRGCPRVRTWPYKLCCKLYAIYSNTPTRGRRGVHILLTTFQHCKPWSTPNSFNDACRSCQSGMWI